MKIILILFLTILCGCSNKNTYKVNHCGGIDIPICYYETDSPINLEEQEKIIKYKFMSSFNLITDQVLQNILSGL